MRASCGLLPTTTTTTTTTTLLLVLLQLVGFPLIVKGFLSVTEKSEFRTRATISSIIVKKQRYIHLPASVSLSRRLPLCSLRLTNDDDDDGDDDDDDGWFDNEDTDTDTTDSMIKDKRTAELRSLQLERSATESSSTTTTTRRRTSSSSSSSTGNEPERDLFIPIFAMVALAGLFGSYGYEMLRLYSRGELYLPWNQ